jgi:hypothetical protein
VGIALFSLTLPQPAKLNGRLQLTRFATLFSGDF